MRRSEVGTLFALSWLLTWFAHSVDVYEKVARLYDFFLAAHPLMPVYFASALVLYRGAEILTCDCDMAPIHMLLSKLPDNLPLEALISDAQDLFTKYPPSIMTGPLKDSYDLEVSFELATMNLSFSLISFSRPLLKVIECL